MTHMLDHKIPPELSSHILVAVKGIPRYCSTRVINALYFQFNKLDYPKILVGTSALYHDTAYPMIFCSSHTPINYSIPIEPPVSSRFSPIQL